MQSRINFFLLVIILSSAWIIFAGEAVIGAEVGVEGYPYAAEITGDNVNMRSGPGTNYYRCGKLNQGARVDVVGSQFSWSRIVPPEGSFSWISKQYVSINADDESTGTVTGNAVRVYAGSSELKPIHSTTVQLRLDRDDKVKLLLGEEGDYYKILPPAGSYLWVSTQYTKSIGAIGEVAEAVEKPVVEKPKAEAESVKKPTAPTVVQRPEADPSVEAKKLREYYALAKRMKSEREKPIEQQDYSNIKKALVEIAETGEAGKAARYSALAVKQIERIELALAIGKELPLQESQLEGVKKQIEQAREANLSKVPDMGKFAVMGQLQVSSIYGPGYYRVVDDLGKMLCYALPSGPASGLDMKGLLGKKIGLIGAIEAHPQSGGALVRFTEIVKVD
ncbi:MAG: SH3 domain-containing protein [Planctomycetota bacterium]|jgi:uncharacterized protein YgiM (DUF1202 family)